MELTETIAFVRRYNAWRRGDGSEQPQPYQIGQALDALCDHAERLEREIENSKDKLDGSEITHEATRADLRDCKRELEQERQDRKQADLDTIRALGERNDARKALEHHRQLVASLQALVTTDHESKEAFIRRCRHALGINEAGDPP